MDGGCPNCGAPSSRFHDVDGLIFCGRCNTQTQVEAVVEAEDVYRTGRERKGPTLKRKKVERDTGITWTTFEAYNKILHDQAICLSEKCHLPPEFLKVVLAIWAAYLEACEAAFVNGQEYPKLHRYAHYRDYMLLIKRQEKLEIRSRKKTRRNWRGPCRRFGRTSLQVNGFSDDDDYDDSLRAIPKKSTVHEYMTKEINESIRREMNSRKLPHVFESSLQEEELSDSDDTEVDEDSQMLQSVSDSVTTWTSDEEEQEASEDEEQEFLDNVVNGNKVDSEYRNIPRKYLSKRSKVFLDTVPEWKHSAVYSHVHHFFIDLMSLNKTIPILYLALRITRQDVHICELVNFASQGTIPYMNASHILPEEWKTIGQDSPLFCPRKFPSPITMLKNCYHISNLLEISVSPPEYVPILLRYLEDMNLPTEIIKVIENSSRLKKCVETLFRYDPKAKQTPNYELRVLALLIVVLKKLFVLDGYSEKVLSDAVKEHESIGCFNWDDWEAYTRLRVNALKRHYLPLYYQKVDRMPNIDAIYSFYVHVAENWNPKNCVRSNRTRIDDWEIAQHAELSNAIELITPEISYIDFPLHPDPVPKSLLVEGTNFALKRITNKSLITALQQEFSHLSLNHLQEGSRYMKPYKPINPRGAAKNRVTLSFPPPIELLLELCTWYLHCQEYEMYSTIVMIERALFLPHVREANKIAKLKRQATYSHL